MRSYGHQPLRRQLVIAIFLLLIPLLLGAAWSGWSAFTERRSELGDQAAFIATTTAAYIDRDITNLDHMAEGLASAPPLTRLDAGEATDLLTRAFVGRASVLRVILAAADGHEIARVDHTPEPLPAPDWPADVARLGRRVTVPMQQNAGSGRRYLVFAYPVRNPAGGIAGGLGLYVNLESLEDAFKALPSGSVLVSLADVDGRILIRSGGDTRYVGQLLYGEPRGRGTLSPLKERAGLDGVRRVYGEAMAEDGPWIVSVGLPVQLAFARSESVWTRSFLILVAGLIGWLVLALVLSRRLAGAVSHLDRQAKRIADGDFSPIEHRPMFSREFAELQDAFDRMLQRFNDTRAALDAQMAEERRIREELQSLQGQVIRQERLAAVGQLVSGVAHEINNPLQAILGFAELLQMQADVPETVKADLRLIQKESARACGIIRNLAMFARQQPGAAGPVFLSDVIASVAELRQRRLESEDIELRVEDSSSEHVLAVYTELQQVILNFVVNAEQAILLSGRSPGRITLRTYDRDGQVVLEVEDTGPGIPQGNEAKLFQPFFTTKPVGQGTGLGLSVSYGIIDSLKGRIGYRRAPAGGAIFYFELPAAGGEAA
jgi:C4-dicarboxylate-specific signal transduction histidine kinase